MSFIGRAFSSDSSRREKKPCLRLPRGTASGGAGDAPIARCETANTSATRVVGRRRRRIGAWNPGPSRERDADEKTDFSSTHHRNPPLYATTLFTNEKINRDDARFRAPDASVGRFVRFTHAYASRASRRSPTIYPPCLTFTRTQTSDASQEEYCNEATLEARLQAVARIMVARPKGAPGGPGPGGPGAPSSAGRGGNASHTQQAHYAQQQGNPAFRGGNMGGG